MIKVFLVDDHRLICDALKSLVEAEPDMEIVGTAYDGLSAVEKMEKCSPDVLVIDIMMPQLNGIEATRRIVRSRPSTKVLALSTHIERSRVEEMLKAGASGYLSKLSSFQCLATAIRTLAAGGMYLGPNVAGDAAGYVRDLLSDSPKGPSSVKPVLTEKEREVLQNIAEGRTTKEIAGLLEISVKTVETHKKNIMEKTGMNGIADLTKYALREGLIEI